VNVSEDTLNNNNDNAEISNKSPLSEASFQTNIDITDIIHKSGINLMELQHMEICPELDTYRDILGLNKDAHDNLLHHVLNELHITSTTVSHRSLSFNEFGGIRDGGKSSTDDVIQPPALSGDDYDDGPNDDYGGYNDDPVDYGADSTNNIGNDSNAQEAKKTFDWDVVFDDGKNESNDPKKGGRDFEDKQYWQDNAIIADNDYNFFDVNEMNNQTNAWAGAQHWKFGTRASARLKQKQCNSSDENVASMLSPPKKKKRAAPKPKFLFDFSTEFMRNNKITIQYPTGRSDSTTMTAKSRSVKGTKFILPPDAKLNPKDLCRLFLSPKIIVSSTALKKIVGGKITKKILHANPLEGKFGDNDQIWGEKPETLGHMDISDKDDNHYDGEVYNDDDYDDYGPVDGDAYGRSQSNFDMITNALEGLHLNQEDFLQVKRKVEKIQIG
jgi:hypothetical protein